MKQHMILFRAKRLDNGEWIVGDLLHSYEGGAIIVPITEKDGSSGGAFSINPTTICQFTGLKDKDDKEIWEHDLVKNTNSGTIYEVIFKNAAFILMEPENIHNMPLYLISRYNRLTDICINFGSKFDKEV